jgi:hypothetical protein
MQQLLDAPRQDLDADEVREALAYQVGGTFPRRGVRVLTLGDVDTGRELRIVGGKVDYSYRVPSATSGQTADVSQTRRVASFEVVGSLAENLSAVRLQAFTDLRLRSGRSARFFHGVFEPQNPGVADDGVLLRRTISCQDKSARWKTKTLPAAVSVTATEPIVAYLKASLTAVFGETTFAIASSTATLGRPMVFEAGTSYLEFYGRLLEGIGFDSLSPDELGRPASQPLSVLAGRGVEATYGAQRGKILTAGTVAPLSPTLPNVLIFSARQGPSLGNVPGNGLAVRRNERTGPASLQARGGFEVEQIIEVDAATQAALEQVADAQQQTYFAGGGMTFSGRIAPNLLAGDRDVVELVLPRLGLAEGSWLVTSWSLSLDPVTSADAALMPITAERRVA